MKFKNYLGFLLGFLVLIAIVWFVGVEAIVDSLSRVNIYIILLAIIFSLANIFTKVIRWKLLCKANKEQLKFKDATSLYLSSLFFANLTPARLGEVSRPIMMKRKYKISLTKGTTMLFYERFVDLAVLVAFAALGFFVFSGISVIKIGSLIMLIVLIALFIGFLKMPWLVKRFKHLLPKIPFFKKMDSSDLEKKLESRIKENLNPKVMLLLSFFSVFALMLEFIRLWLVALAFGFKVNFLVIAAILSISALVGLVSTLPLGLGFTEASMSSLFVLSGLPVGVSASIVLVDRLISMWLAMIIGAFSAKKLL